MSELVFGPQACGALDEGARREWLVADGRGGYAMGTVAGCGPGATTGCWSVAGDTPATRRLALAALDPTVVLPSGAPGAARRPRVGRPARSTPAASSCWSAST